MFIFNCCWGSIPCEINEFFFRPPTRKVSSTLSLWYTKFTSLHTIHYSVMTLECVYIWLTKSSNLYHLIYSVWFILYHAYHYYCMISYFSISCCFMFKFLFFFNKLRTYWFMKKALLNRWLDGFYNYICIIIMLLLSKCTFYFY